VGTRIRRAKRGFAWLLALGIGSTSVFAQAPSNSSPKILTRNTQFKLPVQIDDSIRGKLLEVKLFVKGPNGNWVCQESASPTQTSFNFKATQEGEYWFTFATVDRTGKMFPAQLDQTPPHRMVVIDTTPPEATLQSIVTANRESALQVTMNDVNPDLSSIRLSYLSSTGTWLPLDLIQSDKPGIFRIPNPQVLQSRFRINAADQAGNSVHKELVLPVTTTPVVQESGPSLNPVSSESNKRTDWPKPPLLNSPTKDELEVRSVANLNSPTPKLDLSIPELVTPERPNVNPTKEVKPNPIPELIHEPIKSMPLPTEPVKSMSLPSIDSNKITEKPITNPLMQKEETPAPVNSTTTYINSRRCTLNYVIENVSGPVKLEFWATKDGGKNWQQLTDESGGKSPAQLVMPGDGLYGILIRGESNNQPPAPTEKPDCWIEVDTTKPFVNLLPPTVGSGTETGTLLLLWTAHDKNLNDNSVNIWYSLGAEGPWQSILQDHKNEGVYRWSMPQGLGAQIFLRMEATDRASNVGRAELAKPVVLETPKPKARILSILPAK
jgi:hypothetical protein